jgi:hypothetical protein
VSTFDPPRPRPAPVTVTGALLDGEPVTRTLEGLTLIVAIKQTCDGCRDFLRSPLDELHSVNVLFVSPTADLNAEWVDARHEIVVAPEVLVALGIRWPPFYVLVDATRQRIVTEGVVFAPSQVASEIGPYLSPS